MLFDKQVTLYTKSNCPQCDITKLRLFRSGINHNIVDITNDTNKINTLKKKYKVAIRSMPIIEIEGDNIYDFSSLDYVIGKLS